MALNSFIKVDLHIHSSASKYKEEKGLVDEGTIENVSVLLDALNKDEVALFAITDHNRFDADLHMAILEHLQPDESDYPNVKNVLAGVEFDVYFELKKQPVHIIAIFDVKNPDVEARHIEQSLDKNKLSDPEKSFSVEEFNQILSDIGLNVILIAHQHQGMRHDNPKKNSLSNSASEAIDLLRYAHIDAVEFANPKTEGVLLSDFAELEIEVGTVCGSDCHDWTCYPYRDQDAKKAGSPIQRFTRMKALPTFKGLAMAITGPNTRLRFSERVPSQHQLPGFVIDGKRIAFSLGINAIIGENGSGKTSILELLQGNTTKLHIRNMQKDRKIDVEEILSKTYTKSIEQGELQNRAKDGSLFGSDYYSDVDHYEFEQAVNFFTEDLQKRVQSNIDEGEARAKLKLVSYRLDISLENKKIYHIQFSSLEGQQKEKNEHRGRASELSKLLISLSAEIDSTYYKGRQLEELKNSRIGIQNVYESVLKQANARDSEINARHIVIAEIRKYEARTKAMKNQADTEVGEYRKKREVFIASIADAARATIFEKEEIPVLQVPTTVGVSTELSNGFKFIKSATYSGHSNIEEEYFRCVFNNAFHEKDAVLNISSEETILQALTGTAEDTWINLWSSNSEKFLKMMKKCTTTITNVGNRDIGNTFGEMALSYYEYYSYEDNEWDVLVIDQPEDNISNSKISANLIDHFNSIRSNKQIIYVTHNPLLVVNQDVDNVICLEQGAAGELKIFSGCLEDEENEILERIANKMEGGRRAIRRRLQAYGASSKD